MADRPIIFSAPMIRALLDGRKTQTRRVIKIAGRKPEFGGPSGCEGDPTCWGWEDHDHGDWITLEKEPGQRMGWRDWRGAYAPGDRLWVREAWGQASRIGLVYRSDANRDEQLENGELRWRSPIHMPRWASRLTLTVTDVRVQRVQDMNRGDAMGEGCPFPNMAAGPNPLDWFRALWDSIHGPGAWDRNDWVAALTFKAERRNIDEAGND